jgi:hypothetical protein
LDHFLVCEEGNNMNKSSFSYFILGFVLGITVTIGSAYSWYEWLGGREYIKKRITQEVSRTVAGKVAKAANPVSWINPFSWFGK